MDTQQADLATGGPRSEEDEARTTAFVGRLFEAALGAVDIASVYVGDRLGLYRTLAASGPATSNQLAGRAGIHERYAREWLEQQAVTGIVEVGTQDGPDGARTFMLPAAHAEALTDLDSLFSIAPMARAFVSATQALPRILEVFRSGGGVPWAAYGADMIESQGDFNRAWIRHLLGSEYLPAIPDLHRRLTSEPPARVADVACGVGWASLAIAAAYPMVRVNGFDPDETSIEIARGRAAEAGLEDRVRFHATDAATMASEGPFDMAIVIEAIHDVARPVEVMAAIRESLASDGVLIVADEKVGEEFEAPGNEVERLMYGFSFLVCLPAGLAGEPSAGTGTVMRPPTLRRYAEAAGFAEVEILEQIPHDFLRFYRLSG